MKRPIITTDLDFAHDICGDAALYYNPLDAVDAASKIARLTADEGLRSRLINEGSNRLKMFASPTERYERLVSYLEDIVAQSTKSKGL